MDDMLFLIILCILIVITYSHYQRNLVLKKVSTNCHNLEFQKDDFSKNGACFANKQVRSQLHRYAFP